MNLHMPEFSNGQFQELYDKGSSCSHLLVSAPTKGFPLREHGTCRTNPRAHPCSEQHEQNQEVGLRQFFTHAAGRCAETAAFDRRTKRRIPWLLHASPIIEGSSSYNLNHGGELHNRSVAGRQQSSSALEQEGHQCKGADCSSCTRRVCTDCV